MISPDWMVGPPFLPLVAATLAFLLRGRAVVWVCLATAVLTPVAVGGVVLLTLRDGPVGYAFGGWDAPLGIELYADGLSAFMLVMTAVVGLAVSVYAAAYYAAPKRAQDGRSFWLLWMFLWGALNALFLSADIFNLYVALELLGLSAAALITLAGTLSSVTAGMRYLLVSLLGSLAYLLAVALLFGAFGALDIQTLEERISPGPAAWTAVALMVTGLALKTGLFPLHFWLPPAYAGSPIPVTALLSGLTAKASFYLVVRLWFGPFSDILAPVAGQLLGLLGAVGIVWGSVLALRQRRLKPLLAYSSVSQIGYLFLLFSLATTAGWGFDAWSGGIYQALSHACAKAAMFMAVGTIIGSIGHDDIERMDGIGQHLPLTIGTLGVGGVTLMGLPPSGGFTAKWLLLTAAVESGQWWLAVVILAGGLLAAGYLFRFLGPALLNMPAGKISRSTPGVMELTAFGLALVSLSLGLTSGPLLELLRVGAPFPASVIAGAP
ncbi:MAG TPA: proton-conducting transporter membrane subunit [Rubrobacteraceae bacterium]|nr:proton-conducting transporter membrane subunit [Rubrobacteraceae bacterium]